jgi:cyclophilin family peptidyl-prolyl cis-trans isomerase
MTDPLSAYAPVPTAPDRRTRFERAEEVLEPGTDYKAEIVTNKGRIVVDLFQDRAPVTVNNFVFLALQRYFDGIVFHRVLEDFMAQTGDPTGTGTGGPGYRFADEIVSELKHDGKGVLSMANAGPGTNGSQFFITFTATPWLDGRHTVFGRVIEGAEVLDQLTRVDPQRRGGPDPDRMERVVIHARSKQAG